ncbi:c-type cytochrome [Salibaculum sp.]|uniref:c-type cytochrome n=1 Tax=Salibaculum sp. TaxID=2855480 RepID=UPI0039C8E3E3
MKTTRLAMLAAATMGTAALAEGHATGDPEAGEQAFRQCAACHMIVDDEGETIARGGRVGPNLYGVVDRTRGTVAEFRYSDLMIAAGEVEEGATWDQESFVAYVQDPTGWLTAFTGETGRGKMTFRLRQEEDAVNIWAYLASVGPGDDPM